VSFASAAKAAPKTAPLASTVAGGVGYAEEVARQASLGVPAVPAASIATDMASDMASGNQPLNMNQATADPMLIRTGDASLEVANVDSAAAAVQALATSLGGYVTSSNRQSGAYDVRSATLQLRIPAPRFDEAMSSLRPLGKVEYVNIAAEDVGEEYTDVQARMRNQQKLEARLVDLLASRTGKLEDVLAVERELARVRETIERYEGRLRYLGSRVAMSTLTVTVHEKAPLAGSAPGRNPLVEALGDAWRNMVGFVAGFIAALGVIIPAGLLAGGAWYLIRRFQSHHRSAPSERKD